MGLGDEFARFEGGPLNGRNIALNVWPPPERMTGRGTFPVPDGVYAFYDRVSFSSISDDEIATMDRVARGALYEWRVEAPIP